MLSKCLASLVISATKAMVFLSQKLEPGLLGTSIARQVVVASAVLCLVSCCLFERGAPKIDEPIGTRPERAEWWMD